MLSFKCLQEVEISVPNPSVLPQAVIPVLKMRASHWIAWVWEQYQENCRQYWEQNN